MPALVCIIAEKAHIWLVVAYLLEGVQQCHKRLCFAVCLLSKAAPQHTDSASLAKSEKSSNFAM